MLQYLPPTLILMFIIFFFLISKIKKDKNCEEKLKKNISDDVWIYCILPLLSIDDLINIVNTGQEGKRLVNKYIYKKFKMNNDKDINPNCNLLKLTYFETVPKLYISSIFFESEKNNSKPLLPSYLISKFSFNVLKIGLDYFLSKKYNKDFYDNKYSMNPKWIIINLQNSGLIKYEDNEDDESGNIKLKKKLEVDMGLCFIDGLYDDSTVYLCEFAIWIRNDTNLQLKKTLDKQVKWLKTFTKSYNFPVTPSLFYTDYDKKYGGMDYKFFVYIRKYDYKSGYQTFSKFLEDNEKIKMI